MKQNQKKAWRDAVLLAAKSILMSVLFLLILFIVISSSLPSSPPTHTGSQIHTSIEDKTLQQLISDNHFAQYHGPGCSGSSGIGGYDADRNPRGCVRLRARAE